MIKRFPNYDQAYYEKGNFLCGQGYYELEDSCGYDYIEYEDYEKAIKCYNKTIALNITDSLVINSYAYKAKCLFNLDKKDKKNK